MMEKIDRSVAPRINDLQAMQLPAVTRKHLPNGVELVILNHGQQPVNRLTVVWGAGNADLDNPKERVAKRIGCPVRSRSELAIG